MVGDGIRVHCLAAGLDGGAVHIPTDLHGEDRTNTQRGAEQIPNLKQLASGEQTHGGQRHSGNPPAGVSPTRWRRRAEPKETNDTFSEN